MENTVTLLGVRGSIPVSGEAFLRYGGSTTSILIELADTPVLVDAGTGLLNLPHRLFEQKELTLLLSHPHADHLIGLPLCPYLFNSEASLHLYAAEHEGRSADEQVRALFAPPLWPVGPEELPCAIRIHTLTAPIQVGDVQVDFMEGLHPGGVTLFRVSGGGNSVAVITDCTITAELMPKLAEFSRDCDLLLCDGQYSSKEWETHSTFGHNTWEYAAMLGREAGAKEIRVIHHDPVHTDDFLDDHAHELLGIHPRCSFGREGEVIKL